MNKRKLGIFIKYLSHFLVLLILILPFVVKWNWVWAKGFPLLLTAEPSIVLPGQKSKITAKISEGTDFIYDAIVTFIVPKEAKIEPDQCVTRLTSLGACNVDFSASKSGTYKVNAVYLDGDKNQIISTPLEITVQPSFSVSADQTTIPNNKPATITVKAPAGTYVSFDTTGGTIRPKKNCTTSATDSCFVYFSSPNLGDYTITYSSASGAKGSILIKVVASSATGGGNSVVFQTQPLATGGKGVLCSGGYGCTGVADDQPASCVASGGVQVACTGGNVLCKGGTPYCSGGTETSKSSGAIQIKLINPIKANRLDEFIKDLLNIILTIGVPIVALAIIYSGFLFVKAQGKEEDLKKAKETFFYTIIGAAILLGAWVLAQAIKGTIKQIGS